MSNNNDKQGANLQGSKMGGPASLVQASSYTIDGTWELEAELKSEIEQLLNNQSQLDETKSSELMQRVSEAARDYRGRLCYEQKKPYPRNLRSEISRLNEAVIALQRSLHALSEEASAKLNDVDLQFDGRPVTPAIRDALRCLSRVASTLGVAADTGAQRGRPTKIAGTWFAGELARIWADAHDGEWPTRSHDPNRTEQPRDYGPFHEFVSACIVACDGELRGIDDYVRAACAMGKKRAKDG